MIKMNTLDTRLIPSTNGGVLDDGIKLLEITVGYSSSTLPPTIFPVIKPDIHITYEMYNWREGVTFNDISTLVNQRIIPY